MSESKNSKQETIGHLIFQELAQEIGADVVRKVIEIADREIIDGHQRGAALHEEDTTLQVVDDRFSFLFHGFGPYEISRDDALAYLDQD